MLFGWLRRRRRQKLLAEPFPEAWLEHLHNNVPYFSPLAEDEQARLRDALRIFIAEKEWEGCQGLEITDEMKVTVAGLACLLVLGIAEEYFDRVQTILIYPEGYRAPEREAVGEGVVIESESDRLGEAHYRGPVILSWAELLADVRHPGTGHNLVLHEFAHQLDMLNGEVDGMPLLATEAQIRRWHKVVAKEYERLIDDTERGLPTLLDDYGTKNEGEFFAVATECFFDLPVEMRAEHPKLYHLFRDYFRQDPAARLA
jgi:Mlc titration factor MtfA (ptsG expression regulator)